MEKDNRPSLGEILETYSRLSYKITSALAEFVDNSTANYYLNKEMLNKSELNYKLKVKIDYKPSLRTLIISDNALGMNESELDTAMKISHKPLYQNGRNEFGMGLKTSASWFSKKWRVITKKIGSNFEYTAAVDIEELKKNKNNFILITKKVSEPETHYTKIELYDLERKISQRNLETLINDLASVYRRDLSSGKVELYLDGEKAIYSEDEPLKEIINDKEIIWKRSINSQIQVEDITYPFKGFVGLLKDGSYQKPGLTLLRRGRVIVGGTKENKFKPEEIFKKPNSFRSFRVYGEIELDNWPVTQAKDDFDWETNGLKEQFFIKINELAKDILEKADEYRVSKVKVITEKNIADFGESVQNAIKNIQLTDISSSDKPVVVKKDALINSYSIGVKVRDNPFNITVTFANFDDNSLFLYKKKEDILNIFINIKLPFFSKQDEEEIDIKYLKTVQKFIVIFVISEQWSELLSDQKDYIRVSAIRDSINMIIDSIENNEGYYEE
jgi:hypothetical protein